MSKGHWNTIHRVWAHYAPPTRPAPTVVAEMKRQIGPNAGRTLLLGVTPELVEVAPELVAIDWNWSFVGNLWPGNTVCRSAVVGNWLSSNFKPASFDAGIGDGSLCMVDFPNETAVLTQELTRVIRPGGKLVFRVYTTASPGQTMDAVRTAALRGDFQGFHGFKWHLAMAIVSERGQPNLPMRAVFEAFQDMFPDRDRLIAATGWKREEIDTVDFLRDSSAITSFPTRDQLHRIVSRDFANVRFVEVGGYDAAKFCPLLVAERP